MAPKRAFQAVFCTEFRRTAPKRLREHFRNCAHMDNHVQCLDVGRNPDGQISTESPSYVGTTDSPAETGEREDRADQFSSVVKLSAQWHGKGFSEEESNPPCATLSVFSVRRSSTVIRGISFWWRKPRRSHRNHRTVRHTSAGQRESDFSLLQGAERHFLGGVGCFHPGQCEERERRSL